jgi:hypothetical protein
MVGIPDKGRGGTLSGGSMSGALSARGISIATAKTSVNAGRHRRTIDKSLGTKEALAVRLRKLSIDGEKTIQGVAELAYQQSYPESKAASSRPDCPGSELVFLTYFTTLRLTVFVRRCTVLVRQRGKEKTVKVVYGAPPDLHEQIRKMLPDLMR